MMRDDLFSRVVVLPDKERQVMMDIIRGKSIPPLYMDAVAKKVFNPDVHPNRMNYLLRSIAKDESIDVSCSAANEGMKMSFNQRGSSRILRRGSGTDGLRIWRFKRFARIIFLQDWSFMLRRCSLSSIRSRCSRQKES